MDRRDIGLGDRTDRPHDGTNLWDSGVDKHYDLEDVTRLDAALSELIGRILDATALPDAVTYATPLFRPLFGRCGRRQPPSKRVAGRRSPGSAWRRTAISATR
jgi:hypothetical protein